MASRKTRSVSTIGNMKECSVLLNRNFLLRKASEKRKSLPETHSESSGSDYSESEGEEAKKRRSPKEKLVKKNGNTSRRRVLTRPEEDSESSGSENSELDEKAEKTLKKKRQLLDKECLEEEKKKKKGIACKTCKKVFKLYATLCTHQLTHKQTDFPYKCVLCKEKFQFRNSFTHHMKRDHPQVECYPCEYPGCEESFKTKKQNRDHERFHLKYMCRFCKKGFSTKAFMRFHVKEVH